MMESDRVLTRFTLLWAVYAHTTWTRQRVLIRRKAVVDLLAKAFEGKLVAAYVEVDWLEHDTPAQLGRWRRLPSEVPLCPPIFMGGRSVRAEPGQSHQ